MQDLVSVSRNAWCESRVEKLYRNNRCNWYTESFIPITRVSFSIFFAPGRIFGLCVDTSLWGWNECMEFMHLQSYSKYFENTTGYTDSMWWFETCFIVTLPGGWSNLRSIFVQLVCSTTNHRIVSLMHQNPLNSSVEPVAEEQPEFAFLKASDGAWRAETQRAEAFCILSKQLEGVGDVCGCWWSLKWGNIQLMAEILNHQGCI